MLEFWEARAINVIDPQGRKRTLLTSLQDRRRYKPADIANCYTRRWGIETSYRDLKQTMLGTTLTLRSKTVDGVPRDLGNLDCIQPDSTGNRQSRIGRQVRTD